MRFSLAIFLGMLLLGGCRSAVVTQPLPPFQSQSNLLRRPTDRHCWSNGRLPAVDTMKHVLLIFLFLASASACFAQPATSAPAPAPAPVSQALTVTVVAVQGMVQARS